MGRVEKESRSDLLSGMWEEILVPEGLADPSLFTGLGNDAPDEVSDR